MSKVIVECLCGYSCAIEKHDLETHPGSVVACQGVQGGKRCKRVYKVGAILRDADHRGVFRAVELEKKPELAFGQSTGPS